MRKKDFPCHRFVSNFSDFKLSLGKPGERSAMLFQWSFYLISSDEARSTGVGHSDYFQNWKKNPNIWTNMHGIGIYQIFGECSLYIRHIQGCDRKIVFKRKIPLNFSDSFGLPLGITYTRHLMTNWQWNQSVNFWNSAQKRDRRSNNNSDLETIVPMSHLRHIKHAPIDWTIFRAELREFAFDLWNIALPNSSSFPHSITLNSEHSEQVEKSSTE